MNRSLSRTAANSAMRPLVASSILAIRSSSLASFPPADPLSSRRPSHVFSNPRTTIPETATRIASARINRGSKGIISQRWMGATLFQVARRRILAGVKPLIRQGDRMAKQVTGGKLYLIGGHQLTLAGPATEEFKQVLNARTDEVNTVVIVPGNELMVHWSQIAALQIFSAGK